MSSNDVNLKYYRHIISIINQTDAANLGQKLKDYAHPSEEPEVLSAAPSRETLIFEALKQNLIAQNGSKSARLLNDPFDIFQILPLGAADLLTAMFLGAITLPVWLPWTAGLLFLSAMAMFFIGGLTTIKNSLIRIATLKEELRHKNSSAAASVTPEPTPEDSYSRQAFIYAFMDRYAQEQQESDNAKKMHPVFNKILRKLLAAEYVENYERNEIYSHYARIVLYGVALMGAGIGLAVFAGLTSSLLVALPIAGAFLTVTVTATTGWFIWKALTAQRDLQKVKAKLEAVSKAIKELGADSDLPLSSEPRRHLETSQKILQTQQWNMQNRRNERCMKAGFATLNTIVGGVGLAFGILALAGGPIGTAIAAAGCIVLGAILLSLYLGYNIKQKWLLKRGVSVFKEYDDASKNVATTAEPQSVEAGTISPLTFLFKKNNQTKHDMQKEDTPQPSSSQKRPSGPGPVPIH